MCSRRNKMISSLHIKNIGIIDDISVDLNKGLNILTGETGAGKTLIIDSLGIISRRKIFKRNDKIRRRIFLYRSLHIFTGF